MIYNVVVSVVRVVGKKNIHVRDLIFPSYAIIWQKIFCHKNTINLWQNEEW